MNLCGATAAVHVAGIRSFHFEHGYDDPCQDDKYLVMILKGFANETKRLNLRTKPLTLSHLDQLKVELFRSNLKHYDKLMLWSAFTLAFSAMLRVSEYTSAHLRKFTRATLLRNDIELANGCLKVSLKRDKTHQRDFPPPIFLSLEQSNCCPVRAIEKYLKLRSPSQD